MTSPHSGTSGAIPLIQMVKFRSNVVSVRPGLLGQPDHVSSLLPLLLLTASITRLFCPYFFLFPYTISNLFFQDEPNENSRLIPASEDVPSVTCVFSSFSSDIDILSTRPAARHVIIDQQRMKERLGVIVRAKEG